MSFCFVLGHSGLLWFIVSLLHIYRQTSNISHTLVVNKIVVYSDAVGVLLSALLHLHLNSRLNTWLQWIKRRQQQDETTRNISVYGFGAFYIRGLAVDFFGWLVSDRITQIKSTAKPLTQGNHKNGILHQYTTLSITPTHNCHYQSEGQRPLVCTLLHVEGITLIRNGASYEAIF